MYKQYVMISMFPTPVGMNRLCTILLRLLFDVPHTCGDKPSSLLTSHPIDFQKINFLSSKNSIEDILNFCQEKALKGVHE